MVRLIFLLLNLVAVNTGDAVTTNTPETSLYSVDKTSVNTGDPVTTNFPETSSYSVDESTFYPPSPVVRVRGENRRLHVHWKITSCVADDVTGYTVSAIPLGPKGAGCAEDKELHSTSLSAGESETTIPDLAPYYDYEVNVTVHMGGGKQASGSAVASTSEDEVPLLDVSVIGNENSLHIKWNSCIAANVTGYTVSVIPRTPRGLGCVKDKEPHLSKVDAGVSETTVSGLEPHHDYQVTVTVNTASGERKSDEVEASTLEDDPPSPVVRVSGDNRSLRVHWNMTGCIAAEITGYTVSVIPQGPKGTGCEVIKGIRSQNVSAGESEVTIRDLAAYYDYQVNVTVNTESGKKATGFANATTSEDDPPSPAVRVSGDDRSLSVHWNMTGCIAAEITGYTVSVIPLGPKGTGCEESKDILPKTVGPGESEVTIRDLAAYYDYQVNVTVNTESGKKATGFANATTSEGDPPSPAVWVCGDDRTLSVHWNITGCIAAEITGYTVSVIPLGPKGTGCKEIREIRSENVTAGKSEVTFRDLAPYYDYQVNVTVNTESGKEATGFANATTSEDVPPPPREKHIKAMSQDILVEWEMENCVNGSVKNFTVSLFFDGYLDENECGTRFENRSEVFAATKMAKKFEGVESYSRYTLEIVASTGAGSGPPLTRKINTAAYGPEPVTNLTATDLNPTNATVVWNKPCSFHGRPKDYKVLFRGTRKGFEEHKDDTTVDVESGQVVLTSLRPDYSYTVTVTARNEESVTGGSATAEFELPASIPRQTRYLEEPDPYATDDSTTKAKFTFYLDMFNGSDGSAQSYAILVAESAKEPQSGRLVGGVSCHQWPKPADILQATPLCWNPSPSGTTNGHDDVTVSYIIGNNGSCATDYCNKPLAPGHRYYVTVRVYTKTTYADAKYVTLDTGTAINVGLIVGVALSLLLLGCCILIFILHRRRALCWPSKMLLMRRQLEAQPQPVSLTSFPAYSDYMLGVPARISNEYHMLQTFSKDIVETESCSAALKPDNRRKNRYCNILPFDSTRVVLEPLPDIPSSDYINASYIRGYSREVEYIATQGPKEDTCFDFWRMVHQLGVKLIIMLTNLQESDRVKCHEYFPSQREHLIFGDITIRCTTELVFPLYTSRTFQLLRDNSQRLIVHLHFREWPDFGCPTNPEMLIHFTQAVRHQITLMKPCLTVVHCSAGVGRTGTLIAIDILLQHIREHKKVDIFGTVFNLRRQRVFMVQSEPQYVHIYHCIKAAVTDPKLLDSEKNSTSSTEPIYANIDNVTEPIYANIENGHLKSTELQNCNNGTTRRVYEDGEYETYQLITSGSVEKSSQSECEL